MVLPLFVQPPPLFLLGLDLGSSHLFPKERDLGRVVLEQRLLVVRELLHHFGRQLLYFLVSVGVHGLSVVRLDHVCAGALAVVLSVVHRRLALLVLNLCKLLVPLEQEVADLLVTVPGSEVKRSVSELVLRVHLGFLVLAQALKNNQVTRFSSTEQRRFVELVADGGFDSLQQQVVNHRRLPSSSGEVKQTVAEAVLVSQWVLRTLEVLDDVDEAVRGCKEHDFSWVLAERLHSDFSQDAVGLDSRLDSREFLLDLLRRLLEHRQIVFVL